MRNRLLSLIVAALVLLAPAMGNADELTFDSLYTKELGVGTWVVAFASAIFAGALVYFSGGSAQPLVAKIATWIGSLAGLSGDAATSFGLALLGGGAVADAAWGASATSAVMAALISFSGSVATEETIRQYNEEEDRARLVTAFSGMPALPLPVETSGSPRYEATIRYLHNNYKRMALRSDKVNQEVINSGVRRLERMKAQSSSDSKSMTLLAILYHMRGNPGDASKCYGLCANIIELERAKQVPLSKLTVPLALKAISAMGLSAETASAALKDFETVVRTENAGVMVPVAAAVFTDRYCMRDDVFSPAGMIRLLEAGKTMDEKRVKDLYTLCLLTRYNLKLNERWSGLSLLHARHNRENEIQTPVTRQTVERLFQRYMELIGHCDLMRTYLKSIDPSDHYWLEWWNRKEIDRLQEALAGLRASFKKHGQNADNARLRRDNIFDRIRSRGVDTLWLGLAGALVVIMIIAVSIAGLRPAKPLS